MGEPVWKFEYVGDGNYRMSNGGKYLWIDPNVSDKEGTSLDTMKLVSAPGDGTESDGTLIKITQDNNGLYHFANKNGLQLWNYGTGDAGTNANINRFWLESPNATGPDYGAMHLAIPENMTDSNASHKAEATSVSKLQPGQSVVIYQRVLQDDHTYHYYAIDGNGQAQKVWPSSDGIYWKGDLSIEWIFEELTDNNGNPTGYYRFKNVTNPDVYLAAKADGSIIQNPVTKYDGNMDHVSVNLPGRRDGQYTSKISNWDYQYSITDGLQLTENGNTATVSSIELLDSQDFYFAVREPIVQKQLTTVDTVDSISKGVKITMYDFDGDGGGNWGARLDYMNKVVGNPSWSKAVYSPGIVERVLGEDGYPKSVPYSYWNGSLQSIGNQSLKNIFEPETNTTYFSTDITNNVNHLFLQDVYDSTGYFRYSAFENFARLNTTKNADGSTDFTVYEQIAVPMYPGESDANEYYKKRGNFMPYNDIVLSYDPIQNLTRPDNDQELDPNDPRKGEDLYRMDANTNDRNYFFGMKMEATFQQYPNGLNDRGDPTRYEFNGDDDLWIYIDNVLVLDIGGVHDAFQGYIDFATGDVEVYPVNSSVMAGSKTTIADQFRQAGQFPDGTPWVEDKAGDYFVYDETRHEYTTFKDYSTHDFKMFYMERGAGASNLEMQFNLMTVTEDHFRVTKDMPETETGALVNEKYADAYFYYKAYLVDTDANGNVTGTRLVTPAMFPENDENVTQPYYDDDPPRPIVWKNKNATEGSYDYGIFELEPGHTAVFPVTSSSQQWYVVEVEPEGEGNTPTSQMLNNFYTTNTDPEDNQDAHKQYKSETDTVKNRGEVVYYNRPDDKLVNELQIKKFLNGDMITDNDGNLITAAQTGSPYFEYKVYLEDQTGKLSPYSLGEYYIIDAQGRLVYYVKEDGNRHYDETFSRTGNPDTGYTYTYRDRKNNVQYTGPLPPVTEHTSENGSIADIRDGDTIIISGLLEGTDFLVFERLDRSHMAQTDDHSVTDKYVWEGTTVDDAYTRYTDPVQNAPLHPVGTLYDAPSNLTSGEGIAYSNTYEQQMAGSGTIVMEKDAVVTIRNRGNNPMEISVEKTWSGVDANDTVLANSQVKVTLGRYKLVDKAGMLNITKSGVADGATPQITYKVEKKDTSNNTYTEIGTYKFSANGTVVSLPLSVGTYRVTEYVDREDAVYTGVHNDGVSPCSKEVTITDGATKSADFTSVYTQRVGKLKIQSTFTDGTGTNIDFSNVTYVVRNSDGVQVGTTYHYNDVNGDGLVINDLPIGSYTVTESAVPSAPANCNVTRDPEKAASAESVVAVTVEENKLGNNAIAEFATAYNEKPSNPVTITVHRWNPWNANQERTYSQTIYGYTQAKISFATQPDSNPVVTKAKDVNSSAYTVNWINYAHGYDVTDAYVIVDIPTGATSVDVYIANYYNYDPDTIVRVAIEGYSEITSLNAASPSGAKTNSVRKTGARVKAGNTEQHVTNKGNAPQTDASSDKKYVDDTSFSREVTLTIDDFVTGTNKWAETLNDLPAVDEHGNTYCYYVKSVDETNMPKNTTAQIVLSDGNQIVADKDNYESTPLQVENIVGQPADLTLIKVRADEEGKPTATRLAGAKFHLLNGNDRITAPNVTNLETNASITTDANGCFVVPEEGVKIADLDPGTYKLVEDETPAGYVMTTTEWQFTVNQNGTITGPEGLTNGLTITIPNTPGTALPESGGMGTTWIYLMGTACVAFGLVTSFAMRRRRERRSIM